MAIKACTSLSHSIASHEFPSPPLFPSPARPYVPHSLANMRGRPRFCSPFVYQAQFAAHDRAHASSPRLSPTLAGSKLWAHTAHASSTPHLSPLVLPHGLDAARLPRHAAIIMDGNSRWAQAMGLMRSEGHKAGMQALMKIIWLSSQWGLSAFTAFLFSTENWNRSQAEVSSLMEIFETNFVQNLDNFSKYNIKVQVIGDTKQLPISLQNVILEVEKKTSQNSGLKLAFAINYGGRLDIMQAFQQVATKIQNGKIKVEDLSEQVIDNELWTSWMGDAQNLDLLIRTSGEKRLSNFFLWQAAYSEIIFLDTCWPAMNELLYAKCLLSYQKRDRRFGRRQEPLQLGK